MNHQILGFTSGFLFVFLDLCLLYYVFKVFCEGFIQGLKNPRKVLYVLLAFFFASKSIIWAGCLYFFLVVCDFHGLVFFIGGIIGLSVFIWTFCFKKLTFSSNITTN